MASCGADALSLQPVPARSYAQTRVSRATAWEIQAQLGDRSISPLLSTTVGPPDPAQRRYSRWPPTLIIWLPAGRAFVATESVTLSNAPPSAIRPRTANTGYSSQR